MCYGCLDLAADLVHTASSLSFHPIPGHDTAYKAWLGDKPVGRIMWAGGDAPEGVPPYQVQHIDVHPDHLRQGVATALFNHVKNHVEPNLRHSDSLSEDGEAFARSMGHTAAWDGTTAEPSQGWKPATTPYIARGMNVSHPEDDHDMFHAINEGRATPEHMRKLIGQHPNVGIWWGTYSHPNAPDPHAYGDFSDFEDHSGAHVNPGESVAHYHDSGQYHDRINDNGGKPGPNQIFVEVPTIMVGKRPKRGDAPWDPELHNPAQSMMGNSYLDDDEPVDLHEVHYHNGRDWHTVPMTGHQVTARRR
jgi:GNAT superfamily N-acetyltransferase